jgi:hypothetical protein
MSTDQSSCHGMNFDMDGESENAREHDTGKEGMDDLVELEIENGEIKLVPRHVAMQYITQKQNYDDASDDLGARRKKRRINKSWKVPMVVQLVLGFIMVSVTFFALWYSYLGGELEIRSHFERKKNLLGRSVLRAAAENNDAACKELLERGAYVNFQLLMKIQEAPWHTTLSNENEWVSLSATWSEAAFSNSNASTLDKIAERNVANPLQTLFDVSWLSKGQTADWTATPLAAAVYHGAVDAVALLLLHGADPNMLVRNHEEAVAPLLIAAQCAKFPAISREAHCNPIMMKLLKAGAQASVALPSRDQVVVHKGGVNMLTYADVC